MRLLRRGGLLKSLAPRCKNKIKRWDVTPNPSKASNASLEIKKQKKKKGKIFIWEKKGKDFNLEKKKGKILIGKTSQPSKYFTVKEK